MNDEELYFAIVPNNPTPWKYVSTNTESLRDSYLVVGVDDHKHEDLGCTTVDSLK